MYSFDRINMNYKHWPLGRCSNIDKTLYHDILVNQEFEAGRTFSADYIEPFSAVASFRFETNSN